MATIKRIEDFDVWKNARELATRISSFTGTSLLGRDRALRDQINRSAGSLLSGEKKRKAFSSLMNMNSQSKDS